MPKQELQSIYPAAQTKLGSMEMDLHSMAIKRHTLWTYLRYQQEDEIKRLDLAMAKLGSKIKKLTD